MEAYPSRRIRNEIRWNNARANRIAAEKTLRVFPLVCLDVAVWMIALSGIMDAITR